MDSFIVAANKWQATARESELVEVEKDETNFMVESWFYNPATLARKLIADPLSLFVQFHNHRDERIAMAAEKLLEKVSW